MLCSWLSGSRLGMEFKMAYKPRDPTRHNPGADLMDPVDTGDVLPDIVIEEALDELAPEADPVPSRRPEGSEAAYRHGPSKERGFVGHTGPAPSPEVQAGILNPRQAAAKTALKGIGGGALGLGTDWMMAYSEGARDVDDWMSQEEENITQMMPGLVSPSELPPPAVLSDERRQAVTATQGMAGVAPDFESAPVTEQEIRAFITNRMASGRPLPPWAEAITSKGPDGRVRIEPRVLKRPRAAAKPMPARPAQSSVPMELRRR